MKTYRFFGAEARVVGAVPEKIVGFGALVQIPDERLAAIVASDVQVLPKDEADKLGISDEEYKKFFSTELHSNAPADFLAKRTAAWKAVHEFKESVLNPAPPKPAPALVFEPTTEKEGE